VKEQADTVSEAPKGRVPNEKTRRVARRIQPENVSEVVFEFNIDNDSRTVTAKERNLAKIKGILSAFSASSRADHIPIEPGGETEIQDDITFMLRDGKLGAGFSLHRDDLDERWGREVKEIHVRYRRIAMASSLR
jgi:hypothetical protein